MPIGARGVVDLSRLAGSGGQWANQPGSAIEQEIDGCRACTFKRVTAARSSVLQLVLPFCMDSGLNFRSTLASILSMIATHSPSLMAILFNQRLRENVRADWERNAFTPQRLIMTGIRLSGKQGIT